MNKLSFIQRIGMELEHKAFMEVLERVREAQDWGIKAIMMSHELGDDHTTIDRDAFAAALKDMVRAQRRMVMAFSGNITREAPEEMVELLLKKADENHDRWLKEIDNAVNNTETEATADV